MKKIYIIGAAALLFAGCRPNITIDTKPSAGLADFTNYLAIGNSLTSGYTDGSLTVSGQLNSYPQRLFEQFSILPVHGAVGPFIQPLVHGDAGYPKGKYVLRMTYCACDPTDSSWAPVPYTGAFDTAGDYHYTAGINNGQINNIGVPGIRVADYRVAGYAAIVQSQAPYAYRFYKNVAGTPNDELQFRVNNLHPTFFTMWLGANDVLGYALAGGQGNGNGTATTVLPNFYLTSDITPTAVFDSAYDIALNTAISTGASGALINIPDVTSIPYFTTVPTNGLSITSQGQADTLKAYWASQGIKAEFEIGSNYFMIQDNAGLTRQAVPGELILLTCPKDSIKCKGWGSLKPIPKDLVLTTDELQFIRNHTAEYNAFIKREADLHHLAYVDMNLFFSTLQSGIVFNGITFNAQFATGGAFSLDGVHPTQRGYAMIANEIIKTINSFYKANIPTVDINKYMGVTFP